VIQSGGVCRVCGTALAPPVVLCPRCETQHHRDCWDYNAGCSTYGCIEHLPTPVEQSLPEIRPVSSAELYLDIDPRTNSGMAVLLFLGFVRLTPPEAWPLAIVVGVVLARPYVARWREQLADARDLAVMKHRDDDSVVLESKALAALIGAGAPHQLAQAYALFEQRHPRRTLAPAQQSALALELASARYDVLALEAFDKGLKQKQAERTKLVACRDDLLAGEPAYATFDADPMPGHPARSLLTSGPIEALRKALVDEVQGASLAVVSLAAPGTIAGPYPVDEARDIAGKAWDKGQPAALVPATALTVPHELRSITSAQLSQAGARFGTPHGERTIAWGEVHAVFYGLVVIGNAEDFRPVAEIHAGDFRLRAFNPEPEMFRYLGRRSQYIVDENFKLFVKDLVRFAPHARFSHGVLGLLMERQLPGSRFEGMERLDAYARWFTALGAVRDRYRAVMLGTAS
jgi:hypothetical protein